MGLSDCPCGGHIPLGPTETNRCDKCGRGVWGESDADGTDGAHPAYWRGEDAGVAGAAMRWEEALTKPIPNAGVMREPLESLYRRTEALRARLHEAEECAKALVVMERQAVERAGRYEAALELIAAPMRPDGTYNRSREACEVLARETLGR